MRTEQVEITAKEKSALSIIYGLKQKFAREKKSKTVYYADELYNLMIDLTNQLNRNEIRIYDRETPRDLHIQDQIIEEAIKRSKIKRYSWNKILGETLTKVILKNRKAGLSVDETYMQLLKNPKVVQFIEHHLLEENKIIENLKISVHARYIENNTDEKVKEDEYS